MELRLITATLNSLSMRKTLGLLAGYVAEEDRECFPTFRLDAR